jgi:hypothetical protein
MFFFSLSLFQVLKLKKKREKVENVLNKARIGMLSMHFLSLSTLSHSREVLSSIFSYFFSAFSRRAKIYYCL